MFLIGGLTIAAMLLATAHAYITRCFIANVPADRCDKWMNESVLKKHYISHYGEVNNMEYDIPFIKSNKTSNFLLMKPLYLDNTSNITETWKTVLSNGTDIFRIKFYNKLINMINSDHQFQPSEKLIYVKSCYTVTITYIFYKETQIALNVIEDGKRFIKMLLDEKDNSIDIKEVTTWLLILQTLKIDLIMNDLETSDFNIKEAKSELLKTEKALNVLVDGENNDGMYPSAYLLMYRPYFLDEDIDENRKKHLEKVIMKITFNTKHPDFSLFSKYHHLVLSMFYKLYATNGAEDEEGILGLKTFDILFSGFTFPILSAEDRLINFELIKRTQAQYHYCFTHNVENEKNKLDTNNFKNTILLKSHKYNDESGEDNPNIKYFTNFKTLKDISHHNQKLTEFTKVLNKKKSFYQSTFHTIITRATNIDFNMTKSQQGIITDAIQFLENFIIAANKDITENNKNNIKENTIQIKNESHPCYNKSNILIAHKWLIALYDVLPTDNFDEEMEKKFNEKVKRNLKIAMKMKEDKSFYGTNEFPKDFHLEYLILEKKLNLIYLNMIKTYNFMSYDIDDPKSTSVKVNDYTNVVELLYKSQFSSNIYINDIERLLYIFGLQMEMNLYSDASRTLKEATLIPVVTQKDHTFHLRAIELYGIMLVKENLKIKNEHSKKLKETKTKKTETY